MASAAAIASLRLLIAEPDQTRFTDQQLSDAIDAAAGNVNKAAYEVWVMKAASAADLVDMSEGGSSRKMGDLHEQALSMAAHFASEISGAVGDGPKPTRIRKLARP